MKKTQIDTVFFDTDSFGSNHNRLHVFILFFTFYFLLFTLLPLPAVAADSLPAVQDINDAAQKAKQTYDSFLTHTFAIRMQYEYSGRFLNPQDKDVLCKAAQQTSADLEQIANTQLAMKKIIESYQKDDWEALFGQTGLWRKLSADLTHTQTIKLEIDYRLARIEGKTGSQAEQRYLRQALRSDWAWCEAIKVSMEKIKCLGLSEPNELENIAGSLTKSECSDNPEMLLTLAILQNKYAPDKLKNTLSRHSQIAGILGKIILDYLTIDPNLESLNPITVELVAVYARHTKAADYKNLLVAIAEDDRFKTPDTLAVAGVAVVETEPQKAVKFFMESSVLQFQKNETLLDIDADATAECAARIAYDNLTQNKIDCNLALSAFDNYARIASNKMTDDMQYHYGEILLYCGKTQQALEVFTKLTDGPKSIWNDKASLELLKIKTDSGSVDTLPELQNFILNSKGQDEQKRLLRLEAMDIYCRTILGSDINDSATQVLNLLDTAEKTPGLRYDLFKAQALRQLGRLEESAKYMSKAIIGDSNSSAALAAQIASEIIDKIELWQKDTNDFNELLRNCDTLAEFAHKSANSRQTALLWVEVSTLEGKRGQEPFLSSDENNTSSLRVQARLLIAQEKFEQSAKLWAKIAESKRNETSGQNDKSYGWWQAKFYELDCLAKSPQADKQNIAHAIDVLCGSYPQIPAPWAEKLDILKQHRAAN